MEESERKKVFALDTADDARRGLFNGLVIFINREVPLEFLQFATVSFGAQVGWEGEGSFFSADDPRITHQIVDRPMQGIAVSTQREYVQPQWVFDCINCEVRLPVSNYRPGNKRKSLCMHISMCIFMCISMCLCVI